MAPGCPPTAAPLVRSGTPPRSTWSVSSPIATSTTSLRPSRPPHARSRPGGGCPGSKRRTTCARSRARSADRSAPCPPSWPARPASRSSKRWTASNGWRPASTTTPRWGAGATASRSRRWRRTRSISPIKEPYGVVAAIVPFNFPLLLMAWKVAPALAAGNTLVCKPPHQNPLSQPAHGALLRRTPRRGSST